MESNNIKCCKCQQHITQTQNYIKWEEFNYGKQIDVRFFHKKCWEESPRGIAMNMVGRAMKLLKNTEDKLGGGREQVIEV